MFEKKNNKVRNDYLMHRNGHKYIYKKKVNGKWRYYYYVGKPNARVAGASNKPDSPNSSIKSYTKFQDLLGADEKERYKRSLSRTSTSYKNAQAAVDRANESGWTNSDDADRAEKAKAQAKKDAEQYGKDRTEFMNTPLGKVERAKELIDNGRDAVADMLEGAAKKIRP